jgi:hypothetical protein
MAMEICLNYFLDDQTQLIDIGSSLNTSRSVLYPFAYKCVVKLANLMIDTLYNRKYFTITPSGKNITVKFEYYNDNPKYGDLFITSTEGTISFSQVYGSYIHLYFVGKYYTSTGQFDISTDMPFSGWDSNRTQIITTTLALSKSNYIGYTFPDINGSLPVNVAIKTLAYVEKKIFEYNRKVSVTVQEKQLTNGQVAGWVVAVAGAIGEGFQSATSSSVGAAFVKEMKEFIQLFKFSSGLVNQTKSSCVIDIGRLEESARANVNVTFSDVKAWFNVVGLPAVYKTALGCQTILGKLAMPMATFLAIAPRLEGDHEEYIYLTADNQVSSTETDKRIVIKGKLSTSDFWDLYSQAMMEEFGDSIANGSYSTTANDVNTAAEDYAAQQHAQAQSDYYDAMSEYYKKVNAGGSTVTGTVTLSVPETAKVGLNILEGQSIKLDSDVLDGKSIPLDLTGVESMTPIPIQPVQWDGNTPPPWMTNPIQLHLSDNLSNWTVPNIKIDTPVIPPVTVPDVNVKVDVNVPSIPNINVNVPTIPNIKVDVPTMPSIPVEGAITLTPPESIPLTAPVEGVEMIFDTTSMEAIKAISDNIALRNELETTRSEADTVLRDLRITNEQTTKDNTVKTTEKLYADLAVATSEAAVRGQLYGTGANQIEYVPAQAQAFNNLHDIAERESIALGQVLKFPQGVIPSLMSAHLPALLAEIQQSKITENIKAENQPTDDDWDLTDSALMQLLFFNMDAESKAEIMEKYGEEIELLLKISTPLGVLSKIKEFMGIGG